MELARPDFDARRRRLQARLDGAIVLFAAPIATRNASVLHEYRQESDLYYLTGFDEPETALVVVPGSVDGARGSAVGRQAASEHHVVMFVRPRDPDREAWDGERAGVEGAVARFGADVAYPIAELGQRLPALLCGQARVYHRLGRDRAADAVVIDALVRARTRARSGVRVPSEVADPDDVLHELRAIKGDDELERMRKAAEITRDAHLAVMRLAAPGRHEFELEAALREVFRRNGSERCAYQPIVGSGPNATVLHYRANKRRMEEGELVLVDAGCELDYYASDVTRTFPVGGSFTDDQRRLYDAVLEAQLEAIAAVRPGATLDEIHARAELSLARALVTLGFVEGPAERVVEAREHHRWFNHRTSHWIGMDVHDVGAYYRGGQPRPLEANMVLTIEPGIYVRPDDERAPVAYRGLGVRIEDDVRVTASGHEVLTHDIPKTIGDVERACRG
jgi:Xaa-Pro aminopeptidase